MKRFLIVFFVVLVAVAGFTMWWLSRDTSTKVIQDAARSIATLESVRSIGAEIAITNMVSRSTSGFSILGQLNATDLTDLSGLAEVRVGARTRTGQDETIDVIVTTSTILFRPADVTDAHRSQYLTLTGDTTGTAFLSFDRSVFLKHFGYSALIASGKSSDVRTLLSSLQSVLVPIGPLGISSINGRSTVKVSFRLDGTSLRPFLVAFIRSWTGKSPTLNGYAWVERMVGDLERGTYTVTLDKKTRSLMQVAGSFPLLDASHAVAQTVHFRIDIDGVNAPVKVVMPVQVIQATASIRTETLQGLPLSQTRVPPKGFKESSIVSTPDQQTQIDLFSELQDELHRKK